MSNRPLGLEIIKIVIAGLDNAGKTSFLIALRQKYNFYEQVRKLKPTIKIDYNSFTFLHKWEVSLWDMGGQQKYRALYINNPIYFQETTYLYYIIDLQDELKFESSVNYLETLLDIYRDLDYENEVIVCFNKFDPKFLDKEEYAERVEMLKKAIRTQNEDMKFKFFNMSYYDISSLSKALSYSLNKLLNLENINSKLEDIVREYNYNYIVLYSDDGLIIADSYHETINTIDFQETISSKINDDLEFFQRLADEKVNIEERLSFSGDSSQYVKKFEVGNNIFYVGISAPPEKINDIKEELDSFQSQLEATFL